MIFALIRPISLTERERKVYQMDLSFMTNDKCKSTIVYDGKLTAWSPDYINWYGIFQQTKREDTEAGVYVLVEDVAASKRECGMVRLEKCVSQEHLDRLMRDYAVVSKDKKYIAELLSRAYAELKEETEPSIEDAVKREVEILHEVYGDHLEEMTTEMLTQMAIKQKVVTDACKTIIKHVGDENDLTAVDAVESMKQYLDCLHYSLRNPYLGDQLEHEMGHISDEEYNDLYAGKENI